MRTQFNAHRGGVINMPHFVVREFVVLRSSCLSTTLASVPTSSRSHRRRHVTLVLSLWVWYFMIAPISQPSSRARIMHGIAVARADSVLKILSLRVRCYHDVSGVPVSRVLQLNTASLFRCSELRLYQFARGGVALDLHFVKPQAVSGSTHVERHLRVFASLNLCIWRFG